MAQIELADVFVEMTDPLLDDFDVIDPLHVLTERCVQLLGIAAAGLLLIDVLTEQPRTTLKQPHPHRTGQKGTGRTPASGHTQSLHVASPQRPKKQPSPVRTRPGRHRRIRGCARHGHLAGELSDLAGAR
jgi:hypothetical protein